MNFFRKQSKKVFFLLGLITILLVFNGFSQEQEFGDCEKALGKCMLDNIRQLPNFVQFANGLAYCAVGYAFCLKYLDK
jgi:hypothetical protein